MMKLVFVLLLCGFSASLASDSCDQSEVDKCFGGTDGDTYPKTPEELKKFCRAILSSLDCQLRFVDRCPVTLTGFFHVSLKMNRVLYGKICEEDSPLGAKLVDKAQCLEDEQDDADRKCTEEVGVQDYCESIDPVQKCISEELNRVCGSDGKELYDEYDKIQRAFKNAFCLTE